MCDLHNPQLRGQSGVRHEAFSLVMDTIRITSLAIVSISHGWLVLTISFSNIVISQSELSSFDKESDSEQTAISFEDKSNIYLRRRTIFSCHGHHTTEGHRAVMTTAATDNVGSI